MIERRWIQKGYRIFFAIALLICVGGIPAYAEELVPDAGEITGRVLFISSYSYAWETVPEQIRGIKEAYSWIISLWIPKMSRQRRVNSYFTRR